MLEYQKYYRLAQRRIIRTLLALHLAPQLHPDAGMQST